MLPEILSWDELQNIVREYDAVVVLAHLKKPMSINALALFEEYSRRTPGARFLQFDAGANRHVDLNGGLDVKFCPKFMAFKDGVQVRTYVGDLRKGIEEVLNSVATVETLSSERLDWESLAKFD